MGSALVTAEVYPDMCVQASRGQSFFDVGLLSALIRRVVAECKLVIGKDLPEYACTSTKVLIAALWTLTGIGKFHLDSR